MPTSNKFKIACYMAWCGAEATFPFSSKEAHERAKASLEKIAVGRASNKELPPRYSNVTDLYFIDVKDRDAFNQIMDAANSKQE